MSESHFEDVLLSDCFVDKSLLIKDFLNMKKRVVLVTAPRRFGKSVNLEMLKTFLQIENGSASLTQTEGCSLFKEYNLNIFKYNNGLFHLHCGKYPVIYINLKEIRGSSFEKVLNELKDAVHDTFTEHIYLLESTQLRDDQKKRISLYTDEILYERLTELKVKKSLKYLSQILYIHFNKRVIVLIDEYDAPVWAALKRRFPKEDVARTIKFISGFMSTLLKGNRYVDRALINACVRLSGVLSLHANNIIHFPFLGNHPLVKYYGLTSEEVTEKLNYFNITDKYEEVMDYYDGYKAQGSGDKIYSTWSILKYLENEVLKDYWIDTAGLENLDELFLQAEVRKLVTQLLEWKEITIETNQKVSVKDIMILKDIANYGICNEIEAETFLHFLSDNGYFIPTHTSEDQVSLNIPNKEIYRHLYKKVYSKLYFKRNFHFDSSKNDVFLEALNILGIGENKKESLVNFKKSINDLYSNVTMPNNENALQGNIYFLLKNSKTFSFTGVEVGKKINGTTVYADIITIRNHDGTGIIIETKYNWKSAEEALQQIIDKGYYKLLDLVDNYKRNVKKGRIYIGLHLTKKGKAKVCYLVNSEDTNFKICA